MKMLVDKVSQVSEKYVCSLDVGTTTIRAFIYDQNGRIKGRDLDKVRLRFLRFYFAYVDNKQKI